MVFELILGIPLDVFLKGIVVHGILIGFFLFMSFKICKRGGKYARIYLTAFYFSTVMGFIINFVFIFIFISFIVQVLYYFTLYFLFLGTYFLLIFTFIIYQSEKIITKKRQIIILGILSLITWGMVLIPNGLVINETTNWDPVYSPVFFWFLVSLLTFGSVGPIIYISVKIYKNFELESLKRRWRFFGWGLILLFTFAYGTLISHILAIDIIRSVWSIISLFLVVGSSSLISYGIAKKYK
ncbi:MAG: hypothetical protein ACOC44_03800 [Promethearchaeia archaeon]